MAAEVTITGAAAGAAAEAAAPGAGVAVHSTAAGHPAHGKTVSLVETCFYAALALAVVIPFGCA